MRHPKPHSSTPKNKYEVGAKVSIMGNRCTICDVWWSGECWMYEVEGSANGRHRGLWIHREDILKAVDK